MKKASQILLALMILVLSTQAAFASTHKCTIAEGADLTNINKIAVGMPRYRQAKNDLLTKDELINTMGESTGLSKINVVPYSEVVKAISNKTHIDISNLNQRKAADEFRKNVAICADAYVVTLVANGSSPTVFFYYVYRAGTNELLYTYEIISESSDYTDLRTCKAYTEEFYNNLGHAISEQKKKAAKKK